MIKARSKNNNKTEGLQVKDKMDASGQDLHTHTKEEIYRLEKKRKTKERRNNISKTRKLYVKDIMDAIHKIYTHRKKKL